MGMSTLRFYGKPQGSILTTANAFPLYNLDVDKGFDGGPGLDVTGTVYVSNTLSVNFGYSASPFNGGVIEAAGDVYINNATVNTSIKIKLVGNSNQIYSQVGGGLIADLEFASTGGTITLEGYIRVKREVLYTSGNIDAGTSTFSIAGRHWHSQVNLGPVVLNNLQIEKGYDAYPDVYIVGTINVSGDLGINMNGAGDYMYNGAIDVKGNVSVSGIGGVGGSTQLILSGTGDQTITHTSGGFPGGNLTVNKSSGNIILNSALNLSVTNQSFYIQSGTVNMSGYDLTVNNILTLDSGAVLNQGGGALSYGSVVNNGTINP